VPVTLAAAVAAPPRHVTAGAVVGLAYVSLVSMCLGFFAWYAGMARGGVARVGRLQLAQPALTLGWSVVLLGERVSPLSGAAAVAVIAATAVGRNARVELVRSAAQDSGSGAEYSGRVQDPGVEDPGVPGPCGQARCDGRLSF